MYFRYTEESAPPVHAALEADPALRDCLSVEVLADLASVRAFNRGWECFQLVTVELVATRTTADGGKVTEVRLVDLDLTNPVVSFAVDGSGGSGVSATCSCDRFRGRVEDACRHVVVAGLRLLGYCSVLYSPVLGVRPPGTGSEVAADLVDRAASWSGLVEVALTTAPRDIEHHGDMLLAVGGTLAGAAWTGRSRSLRRNDPLLALGELTAGAPNAVRRWTNIDAVHREQLAQLWVLLEGAVNEKVDALVERRMALEDIGEDVVCAVVRAAVEIAASGVGEPLDGKLLAKLPPVPTDTTLSLCQSVPAVGTLVGRGSQAVAVHQRRRDLRSTIATALRENVALRRIEAGRH